MAAADADMDVGGRGGRGAQQRQGEHAHNQSLHVILLGEIFPLSWNHDGGIRRQVHGITQEHCT
jgi:hypothetical protein